MQWFKHFSNASYDPKIITIRKRWGREGVCRWWEILEIIALDMDYTDKCSVSLPDVCWKDRLGFYQIRHLEDYLQSLCDVGLISIQYSPNKTSMSGQCITILCSKLLELRDNRMKNRIRKKTLEEEGDKEVEKNPSKFVSKETRNQKEACNDDWNKIWDHVQRRGAQVKIEGISELGMKTLQSIGGLNRIGLADSKSIPFIKNDFKNAYK